ncbi:MAG: hypothetical protein AAFQ66_11960 [Pseudomonadota bacterium]
MDIFTNSWWVWIIAAMVFAMLELLLPGYVLLGFASGAAITGIAVLFTGSIGWTVSLPMLLVLFASCALASWVMFRKVFGLKTGSVKTFDHDINDH